MTENTSNGNAANNQLSASNIQERNETMIETMELESDGSKKQDPSDTL